MYEYAMVNEIIYEPAFRCWVKDTLCRQDRIILKVKCKYWRTSHKFIIRVPKTLKQAYDIDRKSGTVFWTMYIEKEMANAYIAIEKIYCLTPNDTRKVKIRPGYEHVNVHMIFDIKMDGKSTRKARLVSN